MNLNKREMKTDNTPPHKSNSDLRVSMLMRTEVRWDNNEINKWVGKMHG